ncbi:RnfH family protein [Aquabacterium sp. OR-4]|uniref:RnfH family protein n=1 Tax=Aquabacterium sp. OR-4 TaxID=2978127 RepID=UPI0021B16101|nr:RnfH family protein [Aquabacterium sp. OR-4]MDT7835366.1 RnfH family protein [Aquabacterium sp. OR-4]
MSAEPAVPVGGEIGVLLVHAAAPHDVWRLALRLPAGATVADALRASGWAGRLGADGLLALALSVWNRAAPLDAPLRDGDRIELSRGLTVDPKEARRLRYRRDGLKRAQRRLKAG